MSLRTDVSVLYVDPRGPYPKLVADWWDEKRDARLYAGPNPVVAHPPCGPWGRLRHLCTTQAPMMHLGVIAVEQVRRWGGVLEHPEGSLLFEAEGLRTDGIGKCWYVEQSAWGHKCQKRTWLYTVGVDAPRFWSEYRRGIDTGRRVEDVSKETRRRTPITGHETAGVGQELAGTDNFPCIARCIQPGCRWLQHDGFLHCLGHLQEFGVIDRPSPHAWVREAVDNLCGLLGGAT